MRTKAKRRPSFVEFMMELLSNWIDVGDRLREGS